MKAFYLKAELKDLQKRYLRRWLIDRDGFLDTDTIEDMLEDPTIQLARAYGTYPIIAQPWAIECDNEKIADFLTEQTERFYNQLTERAILNAPDFGNSAAELVWGRDGAYFIIDAILEAANNSADVVVDAEDNQIGLRFEGETETTPMIKALWFVWEYTYQTVYGKQLGKPAYKDWFAKLLIKMYETRYFERKAIPPPVIKYPPNPKVDVATGVTTDENRASAISVVDDINSDSGIVVAQPMLNPDGTTPLGWDIDELQLSDRSSSFDEPIKARNREILRGYLIPDRLVTSDSGAGTYAEQNGQKTLYFYILQRVMNYFENAIKRQFLDKLRHVNFGVNSPEAHFRYSPLVDDRRKLFEKMFEIMLQTRQASVDMKRVFEELAIDGDIVQDVQVQVSPQTPQGNFENPVKKKDSMMFANPVSIEQESKIIDRQHKLESYWNGQSPALYESAYDPIHKYFKKIAKKAFSGTKIKKLPKNLVSQLAIDYKPLQISTYLVGRRVPRSSAEQRFASGFDFSIGNKKPEQAIAFLRGKDPMPIEAYRQLDAAGKAHAFSTAILEQDYMIAEFQKAVTDALESGQSFAEFKSYIDTGFMENSGIVVDPLKAYHLQTVYRTNLQSAYLAGQWGSIEELSDVFTHLQYSAILDERTRPDHAAQDGKVYPTNHAFWNDWYPSNGYNCRCGVIELMDNELSGLKVSNTISGKPDEGFAGNVGQSWLTQGEL
jgi:SPP1 gp7 family putative phage head morphogenesis protein